jgi:hypothetical protein
VMGREIGSVPTASSPSSRCLPWIPPSNRSS